MSLSVDRSQTMEIDALELVESCLTEAGWEFQRDEDDETIQCIASSKWGDMGGMFANRVEPPALHFSITLDVKPTETRRLAIAELVMMANERLWLGHFDYWADEGVIIYPPCLADARPGRTRSWRSSRRYGSRARRCEHVRSGVQLRHLGRQDAARSAGSSPVRNRWRSLIGLG